MDLGVLQGDVLVFGGNYSNLQATLALRQQAGICGIPPERVICTGDIVAYCAEPEETTQLIRDWGIPVVMGNCEESLGFDSDDCGCGFEEGTACSILSNSWFNFSRNKVSDASKSTAIRSRTKCGIAKLSSLCEQSITRRNQTYRYF